MELRPVRACNEAGPLAAGRETGHSALPDSPEVDDDGGVGALIIVRTSCSRSHAPARHKRCLGRGGDCCWRLVRYYYPPCVKVMLPTGPPGTAEKSALAVVTGTPTCAMLAAA